MTNSRWAVNPCTGHAYRDYLANNPGAKPFFKAPHRSYWRAIGCFDNTVNGTIKSRDEGAWLDDAERIEAYSDANYPAACGKSRHRASPAP